MMDLSKYGVLDKINMPEDVKKLNNDELKELCGEIRSFLIDNVSKTGGHLAANLGIVEISVAVAKLFNMPKDKVVYDVGHQCYVHKILTGRKKEMEHIRSIDGISGFLRPEESEYDVVVSGHASTSISSGIGLLRGETLMGRHNKVVCIIGDGAMTGGMAYEALNDAGQSKEPLIVIYNDNEMSISKNVGALTRKMSHLRVKPSYFKVKKRCKAVAYKLPYGEKIVDCIRAVKDKFKQMVLKESIFEILGFDYLGPCDGNNIETVINTLSEAISKSKPVVVHFKTQKGKGYKPSEERPEKYHGVSPFDVDTGEALKHKNHNFSAAFGNQLCKLANEDKHICAVTAAMTEGTGLVRFADEYPERCFDVGIAEEHAVTMSAALAKTGMIPFFAVYATFLQRGYDQLIHDISIANMHVVFGVDRAGITGEDGETHHGTFDIPQLMTIPHLEILSPSSYDELDEAMKLAAYHFRGPVAIRYPRGVQKAYKENNFSLAPVLLREGKDITIVTYGIMVNEALKASEILAEKSIYTDVVKLNHLTGENMAEIIRSIEKTKRLIILEECFESGCLGNKILAELFKNKIDLKFVRLLNIGDDYVKHGKAEQLYKKLSLDGESVAHIAENGVRNG